MLLEIQNFVNDIKALPENVRIDGCAVFVITHGKDAGIYGTDYRETLPLSDILSEFSLDKCTKLAHKPKLFFIEACRGGK